MQMQTQKERERLPEREVQNQKQNRVPINRDRDRDRDRRDGRSLSRPPPPSSGPGLGAGIVGPAPGVIAGLGGSFNHVAWENMRREGNTGVRGGTPGRGGNEGVQFPLNNNNQPAASTDPSPSPALTRLLATSNTSRTDLAPNSIARYITNKGEDKFGFVEENWGRMRSFQGQEEEQQQQQQQQQLNGNVNGNLFPVPMGMYGGGGMSREGSVLGGNGTPSVGQYGNGNLPGSASTAGGIGSSNYGGLGSSNYGGLGSILSGTGGTFSPMQRNGSDSTRLGMDAYKTPQPPNGGLPTPSLFPNLGSNTVTALANSTASSSRMATGSSIAGSSPAARPASGMAHRGMSTISNGSGKEKRFAKISISDATAAQLDPGVSDGERSGSEEDVDASAATRSVLGKRPSEAMEGVVGASKRHKKAGPRGKAGGMYDDPINLGMLSYFEANELVKKFHSHLNPMIAMLDPVLHTLEFLRDTSTLLLSAIVAASSRFFRPDIATPLASHAETVLHRAIFKGEASIGLIQGLCILVYWKSPTDKSAWIKLGMAVRIAYQLRMHQAYLNMKDRPVEERHDRLVLDRERTWYCLMCFDQFYSLILRLPPTIQSYEMLDSVHWAADHAHLGIWGDYQLAFSLETMHLQEMMAGYSRQEISDPTLKAHLYKQYELYHGHLLRQAEHWGLYSGNTFGLPQFEIVYLIYISRTGCFECRYKQFSLDPRPTQRLNLLDAVERCIDGMQALAENSSLLYLQDVGCINLSSAGSALYELYQLEPALRPRIVSNMIRVYTFCLNCAQTAIASDNACRYVARYYDRLIRVVNAENQVETEQRDLAANSGEAVPFDAEFLTQLAHFLDDLNTVTPDTAQIAREDAFWTSFACELPGQTVAI